MIIESLGATLLTFYNSKNGTKTWLSASQSSELKVLYNQNITTSFLLLYMFIFVGSYESPHCENIRSLCIFLWDKLRIHYSEYFLLLVSIVCLASHPSSTGTQEEVYHTLWVWKSHNFSKRYFRLDNFF